MSGSLCKIGSCSRPLIGRRRQRSSKVSVSASQFPCDAHGELAVDGKNLAFGPRHIPEPQENGLTSALAKGRAAKQSDQRSAIKPRNLRGDFSSGARYRRIGLREGNLRRSEERRVGKECRSR